MHSYDDIISLENLLEAWREFKRGKSKKLDVQEFERDLMSNLITLHIELKNKSYRHGGYEHFVVNDPKRRDINKACVRDRIVHHALYRKIYSYFDKQFIYDSYSCRRGKGTYRALRRFEIFARKVSMNYTKQCWILKCDIRKFFASIDHKILQDILENHIDDTDTLWLLGNVIKSFDSGTQGKGLPLGNLTSQLLVNIYMNDFDQYVKHVRKEHYYIRYADDFVFLSRDKEHLVVIRQKCEAFLTEKLKLSMHPIKVFISTISTGIDFLGWIHFSRHKVLRTTTKRRILRNISERNMSSYLGLLSYGDTYELKREISQNDQISV
jgi:retron-type reverse transcriptase